MLAGDRLRTIGNTPMPATKIFRAVHRTDPCMLLYGCAGDSFDCVAFRAWIEGGERPSPKNLIVLAVDENRRIWMTDEKLI